MKGIIFVILIIVFMLFLAGPREELGQNYTEDTQEAKETYLDTPMNTYKERIEAQNIANTIQTSGSNLNNHINARVDSKQAVKKANSQMEANDKALEAFMK